MLIRLTFASPTHSVPSSKLRGWRCSAALRAAIFEALGREGTHFRAATLKLLVLPSSSLLLSSSRLLAFLSSPSLPLRARTTAKATMAFPTPANHPSAPKSVNRLLHMLIGFSQKWY